MRPTEPLPLNHSWPLFERGRRLDLGLVFDWAPAQQDAARQFSFEYGEFAELGIGRWECDLADNSLTWSNAVYDLFGLPRGASVLRRDAVELYAHDSAVAMDRLRTYAIRHRRGFTLDAELRPATGKPRWMRLIAAPVYDGGEVVRLQGLKVPI